MSRERTARLAAELTGISGTNGVVTATGTSASHAGMPVSVGGQSGAATGGAASAISTSAATAAAPKDPAHAVRMVAARRKTKRVCRRAMADRQRELAEGGPSTSRDETQVISKNVLRKIIEAAGNANPQLTQTLTITSIGRDERFFSGSAKAEEHAAALTGPGEKVYAEREAEVRRAQGRRGAHKRREADAFDPAVTLALAAIGAEPVVAGNEAPDNEEPDAAQDVAANYAAVESAAAGSEIADDQTEGVKPKADAQSADGSSAKEQATDVQVAPAQGEAPAGAATDVGASADSGDSRVVDSQKGSAPVEDAEPEGAPAPDASEKTGDEEEAQASPDVGLSADEQETTPIPVRETSVKHPVQVPPPVCTDRPVMTDTVQAIAPALVPPPAPTSAEMTASRAPEDEADESAVHPGWYAVAEEARFDAETHPTPTVKHARVSIMDFFPAVAPTGAEANVLRAVTGQIPAIEPPEPKPENAESTVVEKVAIDEAAAPKSAPTEDVASEVEAREVKAVENDAVDGPTADETAVMDPVEAAETGALDSGATQILPSVDEPVGETLVMLAVDIAEPASEAVKVAEAAATDASAAEEEAPRNREPAKKTASTKTGVKEAPTKKAATKKATAKNPAAKKGVAKKAALKKAAAKKTSNAGPSTNERWG